MWLPALVALRLRGRQADRLASRHATNSALAGWAFVEGMVWAAAFWIKPFVAVPAVACWLLTARYARRVGFQPARPTERLPRSRCGAPGFKRRWAVDLVA